MRLRGTACSTSSRISPPSGRRFFRVARGITGDANDAAEAVQDGFANAIRSRWTFRGDGPLEAWAWRAVVNAARKSVRPVEAALAEDDAQAREVPRSGRGARRRSSPHCPSSSGSRSSSATTPTSTTGRSPTSWASSGGTGAPTLAAAHRTIRRKLEEVLTDGSTSKRCSASSPTSCAPEEKSLPGWDDVVATSPSAARAAPAARPTRSGDRGPARRRRGAGSRTERRRPDAHRIRPSPAITAQATHVVSAPVGNGFFAHWWHSPSKTGGRCSFTTVDRALEPPAVPARMGGGVCSSGGGHVGDRAREDHPLLAGLSIGHRHAKRTTPNWVPPTVQGSVYEGLHAARVQVEWNGGRLPLVLRDGYFLGGSPKLYMPPFSAFPFYVVAYDEDGREVARKKLESPSLRLTKGGWKQYAREYLAWKKAHG